MSLRILKPAALGRGVRIRATGAYLPERVVTNADLAALGAPLGDEEIRRLSGIRERRWAAPEQATSDLASLAARDAAARAGASLSEVQRLVLATVSPDHPSPSAACVAHHTLGLPPIPVLDLTASCSGFVYALDHAARAVLTGDDTVLAVAADIRSRFLNLKDRSTCALFGDGAGAAILGPAAPDTGLVAIGLTADGAGARSVFVPAGGSREPIATPERHAIHMAEGPQVYFTAVEGMWRAAEQLLAACSLSLADVDMLVPHQPNRRIIDRLQKLTKLAPERVWSNVERLGNMSGASAAVALHECLASGRLAKGARVLIVAGGAGYTVGAALLIVDEALVAAYTSK